MALGERDVALHQAVRLVPVRLGEAEHGVQDLLLGLLRQRALAGGVLQLADEAGGQGSLPKQTQQQILDAVLGFAQSHWDQANRLVQGNVAFAKRHPEIDARDIVPPLGPRPERFAMQQPTAGGAGAGMPAGATSMARGPNGQVAYLINGKWVIH